MDYLLLLNGVPRHLDGLENHVTIKFAYMIIRRMFPNCSSNQADFKYCFYSK